MATNKKNPFVSVPTFYERFGYGAPIEDRLYGEMNSEDEGIHPAREPEEEEELDKTLTDEYEKERQEFIRRQKESMQGYNPYVKQAEMGKDYSKLLSLPDSGASKEEVLELQKDLNRYGYKLAEDGVAGPKTKAALEDYTNKVKSQGTEQERWQTRDSYGSLYDAIGVPTEEEETVEKKPSPSMVDMYGALVPSFFTRMLDMSKPNQYLTADERMRNAARLARRVAPFADSGMAKNIYADAMNRMKIEQGRADVGEQNVLQRRTTAENMWGHYSPAITQALTNASVFMQRAYQADEEAAKLRGFAATTKKEAQELENIIRDRYDQKKVNFYMNGRPIPFDEFRTLVEGNKLALLDSSSIETNKAIAELAAEYRQVIAKKAQMENFLDEANKNHNMALQQQAIADSNKNFAKESQAYFGFPTIKLPEIRFNDEPTPQSGKRGTLDVLDDKDGGAGNSPYGTNTSGNGNGSGNGAGNGGGNVNTVKPTKPVNTTKPTNPGKTNEPEDFENYLEAARQQYLKFERNNRLKGIKLDAGTYSNAGQEGAMVEFKKAYNTALEQNRLKDFSKFIFNDFRFRDGANNSYFKIASDPGIIAFNSRAIDSMMDSKGLPKEASTLATNLVRDMASGKLSMEETQNRLAQLSTTLSDARLLPKDYKVEAYPDGSDIAIIPLGTTLWKDKKTGKIVLKDTPEGRT